MIYEPAYYYLRSYKNHAYQLRKIKEVDTKPIELHKEYIDKVINTIHENPTHIFYGDSRTGKSVLGSQIVNRLIKNYPVIEFENYTSVTIKYIKKIKTPFVLYIDNYNDKMSMNLLIEYLNSTSDFPIIILIINNTDINKFYTKVPVKTYVHKIGILSQDMVREYIDMYLADSRFIPIIKKYLWNEKLLQYIIQHINKKNYQEESDVDMVIHEIEKMKLKEYKSRIPIYTVVLFFLICIIPFLFL